ncbi:MAG: threonine synthase [Candidatus Sumerlaeota bacterium]|nr:threonine synthase [Candidatus Sumerlaeota bacterium]
MMRQLTCVCCNAHYAPGETLWCPKCGFDDGILDVEFDIPAATWLLNATTLASRGLNHWRYRELLPLQKETRPSPEHIGWTPMIEAPRLAQALGIGRLRLKDDTRSASASFKDRASSVGVTLALEAGATDIACASTGNAASSLAHCAAAAGLRANIFVSERIPDGKLAQLLAYGARVFKVQGSYDQAWRLCMKACDAFGWYNRNCAINPYLVEGKKTGGLEIAEQCVSDPPDWVSASVGDGCSIAGIWKGLRQMNEVGFTNGRPKMLGVQAVGVAPIAKAFNGAPFKPGADGVTYADSIDCPVPRNWRKALNAVRESNGIYVTPNDEEIRAAVRETGRLTGCFAEPAAAAAIAGIATARRNGILGPKDSVVAVISGNGLKDIAGARSAIGEPNVVPPEFGEIERIVEKDRQP